MAKPEVKAGPEALAEREKEESELMRIVSRVRREVRRVLGMQEGPLRKVFRRWASQDDARETLALKEFVELLKAAGAV